MIRITLRCANPSNQCVTETSFRQFSNGMLGQILADQGWTLVSHPGFVGARCPACSRGAAAAGREEADLADLTAHATYDQDHPRCDSESEDHR